MSEPAERPFVVNGVVPELREPLLMVNLTGWIDSSSAGAGAIEHVATVTDATEIITFDGDAFIDYRARRPTMEIRDGMNAGVRWNVPIVRMGQDAKGKDLLLLTGPEPDFGWQYFCRTVGDIATEFGVRKMIAVGGYPYGAPHTRPVGLSHTAPDRSVADRLPYAHNSLDIPAGATSVMELEMQRRGITAMSFWAQIPHYVATMQFSAASLALLDAVRFETGLSIDTTVLLEEAVVQRERLDNLISGNPDHADMITKLEEAYDASPRPTAPQIAGGTPGAEQLAEEVERFLREQQSGEQQ